MKVLITGFDPFGGSTINPAYEAVKMLPDNICEAEIIKLEISTVFGAGAKKVDEAIEDNNPDIVICVGQAGGRAGITPEFIGINFKDARIADNKGNQPVDEVIYKDGENAYFTKLPVKAIVKKLKENNIPASVSYTAGTYVCNDVMYSLLYLIDKKYPTIRGGFIHVPFDTSQVLEMPPTTPSMPISMISKGLKFAIEATIENLMDISEVGGATH
ncbi:MAG: pyroglutamyl-peptidase I [Clostridium sp.]|uniref:pyroglutamyl-peptidase I n=1 Tax=Clostridium sp. TaxID=1506 RepID=UPI00304AAC05